MHDDAALARYARSLSNAATSIVAAEVDVLATAREALLAPATRRRHGAHYTPYRVARRLSAIALDRLSLSSQIAVCDPAVGGGIFLVALADELHARGVDRRSVVDRLWGADIDPVSVAVARTALRLWTGVDGDDVDDVDDRVVVGDSLTNGRAVWTVSKGFDLVIGNPPFLNQLQRASTRTRANAQQLVERFGEPARGYVDSSALFMLAGLDLAATDGVVFLIQPQSCLSARDSDRVRRAVDERATLEGLWFCRDRIFDASVRVCAPMIRASRRAPAHVLRWVDRDVMPAPSMTRQAGGGGEWSSLVADLLGVPSLALASGPTLADIGCRATSGFRDQFYGFVDVTHEAADRPDATTRLVTVGMIDPLGLGWGLRTARFAGRDFTAPVVDVGALDARLRAWADARRAPKLLVATQTKVIEVAVDVKGDCVPLTPVIELRPPEGSLWRVAAALTNPVATAFACGLGAGTALAIDAIKLSARQLLCLPVPGDDDQWDRGAALAAEIAAATGDRSALFRELGATMCAAYGQPIEPLTSWWLARLPKVS